MARTIWTDSRLTRFSTALLIGFLIAIIASLAIPSSGSQSTTVDLLKAGDYPAFYSAGKIILQNRGESLYDPELQLEIQNKYWPEELKGSFIAFAYPVPFAIFCSVFAILSPLVSKFVFVLFLFWILGGSLYLLKNSLPIMKTNPLATSVLVFLFAPLLHGVLAGQNTAITLFIYAIALCLAEKNDKTSHFALGFVLALLAFKPNFGCLAIFFLILVKDWRALFGATIGLASFYLSAVPVQGWGWPIAWMQGVSWFAPESFRLNEHQMISIFAVARSLLSNIESQIVQISFMSVAWVISGALILMFAFKLYKNGQLSLQDKLFLLAPLTVLISPHTLYYDLGLIIFSVLRFVKLDKDFDFTLLLLLWILCLMAVITKDNFSTSPLVLVALLSFAFVWKGIGHKEATNADCKL